MKKNKELSFNQKLNRLNEIAEKLEDESIELEDAIALYEEGTQLAALCLETLKNAELTITQLQNKTVPGKLRIEPTGSVEDNEE